MDKQAALAISARCRHVSQSLSDLGFEGRRELFDPFFNMKRSTLAKYMNMKEDKAWKPAMIDTLGMITEMKFGKFGFFKDEMVSHLRNGNLRRDWKVIDLMHADVVRQDRKILDIEDEIKINKYLRDNPRRILSVQRRLPFRHMTDQYLDAFFLNEQFHHGFNDAVKIAKIEVAEGCREDFLNNYDPRKTDTVLGLLSSGLHEVEACDGHAKFLLPEAHIDLAMSLHSDVIKEKNADTRMIPDGPGQLPDDLARWMAGSEVAVAVDDVFLMKVHTGGAVRVFYERGKSREMDQQLDEQLQLLNRVLHLRNEEDSRKEMANWLERLSAGADKELEQHRVLGRRHHARLMRDVEKPPQSEKPPLKIQLPNGKWIELPEQ